MKKLLLVLCTIAFGLNILADDIIALRNGDFINGKVIEVTSNQIKYKKATNLDGPIYTIETSDILSIKYTNGDVDKFESSSSKSNNNQPQNAIANATIAEDNEAEKAQYSALPKLNLKKSNKKSKDFFPIMAFTDSSVISTNEVSIYINPEAVEYYDEGWKVKIGYTIMILNKTDAPIYIDRANCFRRYCDFDTKSYFDNKQTTVTHGNTSASGIGVGIGPIDVGLGGSSNSSHTESYGVERVLVIGPKSKANLVDYQYIRLSEKKAKFKTISDIEYWGFNMNGKSDINQGEVRTYTENDSPYSNRYYITYSTDQQFKQCYKFNFELYAKYIVGSKMKQTKWSMLNPTYNIVKEYQKTIPDFWSNSMSIIGIMGQFKE